MFYVYYAQSPGQIYAQELAEGLLSYKDATQLCVKKYEWAKWDEEELAITAAITNEELQKVQEWFPEPAKELVSSSALLPLVRGVSNDGSIGGATPSHQQETQDINTKL